MIIVAIGTTNKAKVEAIQSAFVGKEATFTCEEVSSQVASQPISDEETIEGAINRAKNAKVQGRAEIGIGLEGGVAMINGQLYLCNWGALTDGVITVTAGGARIPLPESFLAPIKQGVELGELMDAYTNRKNIRNQEGAVGIFTADYVSRKEMFTHIVKLLLGQYEYHRRGKRK